MPSMYRLAVFSSGLSGVTALAELSGPRCFVRYSVATSISLSSNWAPYPTILRTSFFQASRPCFRLTTGFRLWQFAHRSSMSFLPSTSTNSCGAAIDRAGRLPITTSQIAERTTRVGIPPHPAMQTPSRACRRLAVGWIAGPSKCAGRVTRTGSLATMCKHITLRLRMNDAHFCAWHNFGDERRHLLRQFGQETGNC